MEVFIGFTKDDDFTLLQATLERWDACANVQLAAIECDPKKFEIARRVAADNMAKMQYYILADLGCVLEDWKALEGIEERLGEMDEGLIGLATKEPFTTEDAEDAEKAIKNGASVIQSIKFPTGVRICRKGAVEKWVPNVSGSYDQEHVESVKLTGGSVWLCPDIFYTRISTAKAKGTVTRVC